MEAMANSKNEETINNEIREATCGLGESFTYTDAVSAGIMSDDQVERDMDVEDDDIENSKIEKLIDSIPVDDDEDEIEEISEESLNVVDALLESVIEE